MKNCPPESKPAKGKKKTGIQPERKRGKFTLMTMKPRKQW